MYRMPTRSFWGCFPLDLWILHNRLDGLVSYITNFMFQYSQLRQSGIHILVDKSGQQDFPQAVFKK